MPIRAKRRVRSHVDAESRTDDLRKLRTTPPTAKTIAAKGHPPSNPPMIGSSTLYRRVFQRNRPKAGISRVREKQNSCRFSRSAVNSGWVTDLVGYRPGGKKTRVPPLRLSQGQCGSYPSGTTRYARICRRSCCESRRGDTRTGGRRILAREIQTSTARTRTRP